MKALFYTLGCKVNQYETQAMRALLDTCGYQTEDYAPGVSTDCDVIVINSCTVTGESDRKLRQIIRRCRRENPTVVLVLTGCMPQAFPEEASAFEEVDIVLGNAERKQLPKKIATFFQHRQRIIHIPAHNNSYENLEINTFCGRTRAFIKIQDGCNRFCSYCIIPYARGRVRSRGPEDIRRELETLTQQGYQEVVLVGINLSAYGQDNGLCIADAVEAACSVPGIRRVRLGSLEPDFMTENILQRLAAQPKLCPQFHVALQSGCDSTLKRMNRHYNTAEFSALCMRLRELFPNCALTTDVMVGFPGESDEEFIASLNFVRSIGFSRVHVFAYSRRPGTVADRLPDQVPSKAKVTRSRAMIETCRDHAIKYARKQIGSVQEVLLETPLADGYAEGHTATYLTVRVKTDKPSGCLVQTYLENIEDEALIGKEI